MEEIKVGEWVRSLNGKIAKVYKVEKVDLYTAIEGCKFGTKKDGFELWIYFSDDDFPLRLEQNEKLKLKHSPNIIDLIQIEDIVKVKDHDWIRVFNIDDKDTLESFIEDCEENNWTLLSIVTKEAFKSVEYTIRED